eukprot:3175407-Pyramimonas_sp.AAC.1
MTGTEEASGAGVGRRVGDRMAGTCARRDLRGEASWRRCPKWLPSCGTTRSRSPACPRVPPGS